MNNGIERAEDVQEARTSNHSAVVLVNGDVAPPPQSPSIVNNMPSVHINQITKSDRIHIGTKILSINQTVKNTEGIKSLKEPWYQRRVDWQALRPYKQTFRTLPVKYVVIGHTATQYCNELNSCIEQVLNIQKSNLNRGSDDIMSNYLLGGNGYLFEGTGANIVSAMVKEYNTKSITLMFIGDYTVDKTDDAQFDHLQIFLDVLVKENILEPDYIVIGKCQIQTYTVPPGPNVMHKMNKLKHWNPMNAKTCVAKG